MKKYFTTRKLYVGMMLSVAFVVGGCVSQPDRAQQKEGSTHTQNARDQKVTNYEGIQEPTSEPVTSAPPAKKGIQPTDSPPHHK